MGDENGLVSTIANGENCIGPFKIKLLGRSSESFLSGIVSTFPSFNVDDNTGGDDNNDVSNSLFGFLVLVIRSVNDGIGLTGDTITIDFLYDLLYSPVIAYK